MEATSEDETVETVTKTIKIINENTILRISFVTKYNEWSKRFETTFNSLTKTKKNLWLSVSPDRYLQFSITSILVLFFLESIRCKNTTCYLTGFAFMSFLITWTFLVALKGNLSKRDGAINSVIIYVGSLANLCQIMTDKLNRTRQLLKIIAGPNFLHTIPNCCKSPEKLQLNILLHSWLRLCLSWMDVWGIIFAVQISITLYVFEFPEFPRLLQCLSGLLIIVGIFTQNRKIKRCRLEVQQTSKILRSITLEYFQWFEKKCALRALILKSGYFDLDMEDIFPHRFNIFEKDSVHSQLMYSLIAVGMAYGLQHETRETFLTDAVRLLLFNKRPKLNPSSLQNIHHKERKIPHDNFKKKPKSCIDYLNIFTNWLNSQKLTSSTLSEVPNRDKNATNKEIIQSLNHAKELKELIEENAQATTHSQVGLEEKRQESSKYLKMTELKTNCKEEEQALEINQSQEISNTVHVTKGYQTLKQDELTISNDNTENKERIMPDNISNVTKVEKVTQKSTLEPTTKPVNIQKLEEESDVFTEQIPPHVNLEQLEQESVVFVDDIKMVNKCIVLNQAVESNLSIRNQEITKTDALEMVTEDSELGHHVSVMLLNDNVSCDILSSSYNDANLSLNELESLTNNSNEIENTRECSERKQLNTTEIESANFKMYNVMGYSEFCKVCNQYQINERLIVSENENDSRNKNSPALFTHYVEGSDEALSTDGIFSSLESEITCDSNYCNKSTNNSEIEEICAGNDAELINKLKNKEKTSSFPNSTLESCGKSSQYSTKQNEINFQNAKDRRKYTRLENFKCYTKRTSRKGNQKYTGAGQQNTVQVSDNYDDPEVQTAEKFAYEMLEESCFEFCIKNPIQNDEKINPFTDFKSQSPTINEYFTGCSSFNSGVLYTQQSNNFSEQSNFGKQAIDPQDITDDEESSTHSEHSPKPQKRNFRWISDEDVILELRNGANINTEDLHDNSFVDEESAQPSVNITEPITYSLKCGNMNLEFTENSPNVSLRFICESNENVVLHKAPKRIISKTISDEEELTYPENKGFYEDSYDSESSLESSTVKSSSETTMYRHIPDSDHSSLTEDDHIEEILLKERSHIDKVPLSGHGHIEEIPTACRKAAPVDGNINQDLHFETDNVKLNFVPTPNSGTLEVDYRQSYGCNRLIFKSNDKKLKLKIKK